MEYWQRLRQSPYFQVLFLESVLSKPSLSKDHITNYTLLLHRTKNSWAISYKSEFLFTSLLFEQIFCFWMTPFHGLTWNRILVVDEFIAQLWQVHLKVKDEGYVQV